MGLTDKQKAILQKNGYNPEGMEYATASKIIGEILSKPKESQFSKTLPSKEVVSVEQKGFKTYEKKDVNPFYVAYAKDLAIAMIEAQIAQKKDVNAVEIMDLAIMMVGAARQRLKEGQ